MVTKSCLLVKFLLMSLLSINIHGGIIIQLSDVQEDDFLPRRMHLTTPTTFSTSTSTSSTTSTTSTSTTTAMTKKIQHATFLDEDNFTHIVLVYDILFSIIGVIFVSFISYKVVNWLRKKRSQRRPSVPRNSSQNNSELEDISYFFDRRHIE